MVDDVWCESDSSAGALIHTLCKLYKGLKVFHFNARSLNGIKLDYVRHVFASHSVDVLCVSETWFNEAVPDSYYSMHNYTLFRNDRKGRRGGGVAIYLKKGLKAKIVSKSTDSQVEFISIAILGNIKVLISCVYNPDRQYSLNPFFEDLSIRLIDFEFYIVCGDFNINILNSKTSHDFRNQIASSGLEIVNTVIPTRYSVGSSPSLLDVVAVSDLSVVTKFDQLSFVSDHDLIFCSLAINVYSHSPVTSYCYRDFNNINLTKLYSELLEVNWSHCWSLADVNDKLHWFMKVIGEIFDHNVIIKTAKTCSNTTPWFTNDVLAAIRVRNKSYSRWKRYPNEARRLDYIRARNSANQAIRCAKCSFFATKLNNNLSTKQLWKNIRKLQLHSNEDKTCILDSNELNSYFSSVFLSTKSPTTPLYYSCAVESVFEFSAVSESDIIHHITSITSNAVGFDGIPIRFVKLILPYIVPTLTHIFNHCLTTSQFPDLWKVATITPIAKKSNATSPNDYRPISILPALAKVFEKILAEQINTYLECKNLVSPLQSGFRAKHSCNTAMMKILDDIRVPFDNNWITLLCLLDFSKAFDTINHKLLCRKLQHFFMFSTTAVKLIDSYLCNRRQRVCVQGEYSDLVNMPVGVPQGSILGPLLFVLFVNDIFNLYVVSTVHAYADDVQLHISSELAHIDDLTNVLNCDLKIISSWSVANGLALNVKKCQVLPISYKALVSSSLPQIFIDNQVVDFVTVVKNLGFLVNSKLTCTDHVNSIVLKIYRILRCLRLSCSYTPLNVKRHLVLQLIMPHIQYFSTVYSQLDSASCQKLSVMFNNAVRYVFNLRRFDHVGHLSRCILGVGILQYLEIRNIMFLHGLMCSSTPGYLKEKIVHCRSNRLRQLVIPKFNHLNSSRLFFVNAIRLWNALPSNIRLSPNTTTIKKALYAFYSALPPP